MSDTSILPPEAAAPAAGPDFGDEPGDDRRRLMIIGGAIAGVLVLVVGYMLLSGGGGGSADDATGVVARGTPHAASSPAPDSGQGASDGASDGTDKGGAKAGTTLPGKSKRQLTKDPFKALVIDPGTVSSGTVTPVGGTTAEPGTVPTSPTEGGAPDASLGPPLSIRLVDVLGKSIAVFDVTYSHHQVFRFQVQAPPPASTTGTVFAQDFSLLGIQGKIATLQIGDDTPFDMRQGSSRAV